MKQHVPGQARDLHQDVTLCRQKGAGLQPGFPDGRLGTGLGVPCPTNRCQVLCLHLLGRFLPPSQSPGSIPAPHKLGLTEPCSLRCRGRLSCVGAGGRE